MNLTPETRSAIDRVMIDKIHPVLRDHFAEWKQAFEDAGVGPELSGFFVINQLIGFALHTRLYNSPDTDRESLIRHLTSLVDETMALFEASRKRHQ